jgi:monofunctional biosynthetic peptidoglycan transglycosylase
MRRIARWLARALALFIGITVSLTALYSFVPPPITPLMVIRLFEGDWISKDWVPYEEISPNLARAVIASEDSGFCEHWGYDIEAIRKALRDNETSKRLRGGSTISNQTAKNTFLWPGDSRLTRYARKGIEPYFTTLIELMWGKKRILEVYLNVAEWGRGIYGAEAAAQHHFRKSAAELTRREAALLAAVLPSPRRSSAGKPSNYISGRASTIQARMNDIADPTGDPCR